MAPGKLSGCYLPAPCRQDRSYSGGIVTQLTVFRSPLDFNRVVRVNGESSCRRLLVAPDLRRPGRMTGQETGTAAKEQRTWAK